MQALRLHEISLYSYLDFEMHVHSAHSPDEGTTTASVTHTQTPFLFASSAPGGPVCGIYKLLCDYRMVAVQFCSPIILLTEYENRDICWTG